MRSSPRQVLGYVQFNEAIASFQRRRFGGLLGTIRWGTIRTSSMTSFACGSTCRSTIAVHGLDLCCWWYGEKVLFGLSRTYLSLNPNPSFPLLKEPFLAISLFQSPKEAARKELLQTPHLHNPQDCTIVKANYSY